MERAKKFYTEVMGQENWAEHEVPGFHVVFKNGFGLQYDYKGIVEGSDDFAPQPTGASLEVKPKGNSFQIGFEVEDLDAWVAKIQALGDIEFVHDITRYSWGQRVARFYDYDGHIIELGEVESLWVVPE